GQMHIRTVRGLPAVDMRIVADHEDHGVSALHGGSELVESMRVHLCREPGGVAGSMVVEGEGAAVMLDADEPPGTGVLKLPRAICADGAAEDLLRHPAADSLGAGGQSTPLISGDQQ